MPLEAGDAPLALPLASTGSTFLLSPWCLALCHLPGLTKSKYSLMESISPSRCLLPPSRLSSFPAAPPPPLRAGGTERPGGSGHGRGVAASRPPAPGSITDLLCWSTGACAEPDDFSLIGADGEKKRRGQSLLLHGQERVVPQRATRMGRRHLEHSDAREQ